jgi:hypothetical protein
VSRGPIIDQACWRLVNILSRSLRSDERDAVLGDFKDAGETAGNALRGILGLIVRRRLGLWTRWQPWLALIGIAGFAGLLLQIFLAMFTGTLFEWLVGYANFRTPNEDIVYLVCLALALPVWSWTSGFALGSLSGRTILLTGALFFVAVLNPFWLGMLRSSHHQAEHIKPAAFEQEVAAASIQANAATLSLCLLPAFWGIRQGFRHYKLKYRQAFLLGIAITSLILMVTWSSGFSENTREAMSNGVYRAVSWPNRLWPLIVLNWPAVYVIGTSYRVTRRRFVDKENENGGQAG